MFGENGIPQKTTESLAGTVNEFWTDLKDGELGVLGFVWGVIKLAFLTPVAAVLFYVFAVCVYFKEIFTGADGFGPIAGRVTAFFGLIWTCGIVYPVVAFTLLAVVAVILILLPELLLTGLILWIGKVVGEAFNKRFALKADVNPDIEEG